MKVECDRQTAGETCEALGELILFAELGTLTETQWNRIRRLQDALLNAERGIQCLKTPSLVPPKPASCVRCLRSSPPAGDAV